MRIKSSFKNLPHTESLDEKIYEKSSKLEKYFDGNFDVHWFCSVGEDGKHWSEVKFLGPQFEYFAKAYSDNLYKTFDLVIAKIEKQVVKKKEKWKGKTNYKYDSSYRDVQLKEQIWDEEYWEYKDEEDLAS